MTHLQVSVDFCSITVYLAEIAIFSSYMRQIRVLSHRRKKPNLMNFPPEYHGKVCILLGILDACVDRVWSFDVFVHTLAEDIEPYVAEITRVLKPGGRAIIHHARDGQHIGWRFPSMVIDRSQSSGTGSPQ